MDVTIAVMSAMKYSVLVVPILATPAKTPTLAKMLAIRCGRRLACRGIGGLLLAGRHEQEDIAVPSKLRGIASMGRTEMDWT